MAIAVPRFAFHALPQLFLLPGVTSTEASHLKHFLFRHGRRAMRMPGKNEMLEFELNPGRSRCDMKSRGARQRQPLSSGETSI
jgi:hypothetical protein